MKYRFIAKDLNNNTIRGYEFGENNIELLRKLKKKKLFCIKYFEVKDLPIEKFSLVSYKDIAMFLQTYVFFIYKIRNEFYRYFKLIDLQNIK